MASLSLEQALQLALAHHQAGRLAEAESLYRAILQQLPQHAESMHLLGVLAGQIGKPEVAIDWMQRAIGVDPGNAVYHSNISGQLTAAGRFDDAIAAAQRAVALRPGYAEAHVNLAHAYRGKQDFANAIAACRVAVRLRPDLAPAYSQLGIALRRTGDLRGAIEAYRQALTLQPTNAQTHNDLGIALSALRSYDEAIGAFREAIRLQPGFAQAHNNLGTALKDIGRLTESTQAYERALELQPSFAQAYTGLISALIYRPDISEARLREVLAEWNRRYAAPLRPMQTAFGNERNPARKLRIGYVSADFRLHVVAFNILPFLRRHDRSQLELFLYSNTAEEDAITDEFRRLADHWRPILGLSDEQAAQQVRADGIDILVDLSLHTLGNRLLVFARKPAPVQVTFAGYPGSTGVEAIDYRLTDPYLDPPGTDNIFVEKSLRLPHCFWCYEPRGNEPEINALPALSAGHITFGCLNTFCKINEQALALWGRVLNAVPGSRLVLQSPEGTTRADLLATMQSHGVAESRITFAPRLPHREYLRLYHEIDIFLDTFPYNAHTTGLDSLYMGVPLVTMAGQTVVGRAGVSQLTNLGLPELIARTPEEFVRIAVELASDLPRLQQLRTELRDRMRNSPLMDVEGFTRDLESAYRTLRQNYCASTQPETLHPR